MLRLGLTFCAWYKAIKVLFGIFTAEKQKVVENELSRLIVASLGAASFDCKYLRRGESAR